MCSVVSGGPAVRRQRAPGMKAQGVGIDIEGGDGGGSNETGNVSSNKCGDCCYLVLFLRLLALV
jgi:hypothetical protein